MKTKLIVLFSLFALILSACAVGQPSSDAVTPTQTPVVIVVTATNHLALAPTAQSSNIPMDKCEWLEANVPQGNDGIDLQNFAANLLGVPVDRIRVHLYPCGNGKMVYDGFIVLGPREGNWTTLVTAQVPVGGAIDSYNEATYSVPSMTIGQNTKRAVSGTVTATTMTYWFWLDEAPPVSGEASPATTVESLACMHTADLAKDHGWKANGLADKYGGLVVTLSNVDTLPADWEAVAQGRTVKEFDADRSMSIGTWTVYPPYSCRVALGYSQ